MARVGYLSPGDPVSTQIFLPCNSAPLMAVNGYDSPEPREPNTGSPCCKEVLGRLRQVAVFEYSNNMQEQREGVLRLPCKLRSRSGLAQFLWACPAPSAVLAEKRLQSSPLRVGSRRSTAGENPWKPVGSCPTE